MKKSIFAVFVCLCIHFISFSQVFGPNSPSTQIITGGGNTWSTTNGVLASDNTRAVVNVAGFSRQLIGRNFGFSLVDTDVVAGIELEIERRATLGNPIDIITPWTAGENSEIPNFTINAGQNRTLILFVGAENGNDVLINNVTIGGRQMTRLLETSYETSFWAHTECWYLKEADIALLTPGNYDIDVTYNTFVNDQFFDILSAALFSNVDQGNPFFSFIEQTVNGATPATTGFGTQSITAGEGGMYLTNIFCGNNTSPASVNGGTNTFTINSGFIEGHDRYRANTAVSPNTGGCMQTAYKFAPLGGTESPSFTFNGSANRRLAIGIGLRKVSAVDISVHLQKGGVNTGANQASTTVFWPTIDEYVKYGGPTDLWGDTWEYTDINNSGFGAAMAVEVYNGSAQVDHMRITVYTTSILPVELIEFYASQTKERKVMTNWITASELNSDYFEIERSSDGFIFETVGTLQAAGNSNSLMNYQFEDMNPLNGNTYYRLKTVDIDGTFEYSDIKQIELDSENTLIYPNPVINWAKIAVSNKSVSISIVSSAGQIIDQHSGYFFNDDYHFNISQYPDGVYYLIVNEFGSTTTQRFVKQSN